MDSILMYLLEANVLLLLLAGVYFLVRNQLSFKQRRFSLIAIPVMAMLVIFIRLADSASAIAVYHLPVYELNALTVPAPGEIQTPAFGLIYSNIYLVGLVLAVLLLLFKTTRLFLKFSRTKIEKRDGLRIVHLENEPCFSFLNYVQLNPALSDEQQQLILEHEKIHIAQKHSYDKLFMAAAQTINWFNPLFIALKKELMNVHEYEVDQFMYRRHQTHYMEFLLAYSLRTNSNPYLLTNQFHSKNGLIKRLHFMKKQPKNNWALALGIPMVASAFALVSWTFSEGKKQVNHIQTSVGIVDGEIEKMPEFKGGQEALINYLVENLKYPTTARENKIEGTVYISFIVTAKGKVTQCTVKRSADAALDAEALRVVESMPDWIPGEDKGKRVNAEMVLPVSFKL